MFYSVPASDDFIYGSFVSSNNVFINALEYVKHTYFQGSCRWLIFFLQKCINPLNLYSKWHIHLGHIYGVSVIIVFAISMYVIIYSIKFIVDLLVVGEKNKEIITFLIVAVLLSTYYYSEVYNWYTGGTAYAIPFSVTMLLYVTIIKYFKLGKQKKDYIMLFVVGILPATNEFLCVPIGIIYLYYYLIDYKGFTDKHERLKNIVPLLFYIVMGSTVVFAPGTFARRDLGNITVPMWRLVMQAIINPIVRVKDIITTHPLAIILFVLIFFYGIKTRKDKSHNIIIYMIIFAIGVIGAILPYCLGKGNTNTYMDVRVYYLMDYLLLLSMCFIVLMIGQNFALKYDIKLDKITSIRWGILIMMFSYLLLVPQSLYLKIPQIDIVKKSGLIRESYAMWDGILSEIENSDEDNVVLVRDKALEWSPYFLYVGLEPDNVYDQSFDSITPIDEIMINVFYKKKSIELKYTE